MVEKTGGSLPERSSERKGTRVIGEDAVTPDTLRELLEVPDQEFWQRARDTYKKHRAGSASDAGESFDFFKKYSFENSWQDAKEKLGKCDRIIMIENGGLGDDIYILLDACAVAMQFPQAEVLVKAGALLPLLRADIRQRYPNLKLFEDDEQMSAHISKEKKSQLFVDMGAGNAQKSYFRAAMLVTAAKRIQLDEAEDNRTKLSALIGGFTRVMSPKQKKSNSQRAIDSLGKLEENEQFKQTVLVERTGVPGHGLSGILEFLLGSNDQLVDFLEKTKKAVTDRPPDVGMVEKKRDRKRYQNASQQMLVRAARLKYLLGLETAEKYLDANPFQTPENISQKEYDVMIVYDAKAQADKVLPAEKIAALAAEVKRKNPSAKIGVVIGKTNPDIAKEALRLDPSLVPIEGTIPEVFEQVMKSRMVISVDTFWQHMVNLMRHFSSDAPELMTIFSTLSDFPPGYFRPDMGKVALVDGPLQELDHVSVVDSINFSTTS